MVLSKKKFIQDRKDSWHIYTSTNTEGGKRIELLMNFTGIIKIRLNNVIIFNGSNINTAIDVFNDTFYSE